MHSIGLRNRLEVLSWPTQNYLFSQVAQWLRAGGAGNVLIPNLSDTTNTSKV